MSSILETLRKLIATFEEEKADYALIGGLAVPAYGQVRATQDVDVVLIVRSGTQLKAVYDKLRKRGFTIPAEPRLEHACNYIADAENMVHVEIWLHPSGLVLDRGAVQRRRLVEITVNLKAWILGPEDLIVNKLAREDRSALDEGDVVSILSRQKERLDRRYLESRARKAGVYELLKAIEREMR